MQITTMQEFEGTVGTTFESLRDSGTWGRHRTRFATGREAGALSALARQLAEIANSHAGSTLVMHEGAGGFLNPESTYLLQVFRRSFAERRALRDAPAYTFSAEENTACAAMLSIVLHNFCDFMLLSGNRRMLLWGSHEQYIELHTLEEVELKHLHSVFTASGLRELSLDIDIGQMAALGDPQELISQQPYNKDVSFPPPHSVPAPETEIPAEQSDPVDDFLAQTRELARNDPGNIAMLERLARSVVKRLIETTEAGDQHRRNSLLEELRTMARENPADAVVRESLAQGLAFLFRFIDDEAQVYRLVSDLRDMVTNFPEDPELRSQFAIGLYNAYRLLANPVFIEESRQLAERYPEDSMAQELLAVALNCAMYFAFQEQRNSDAHALLDELRLLAKNYPEQTVVLEQLAGSLTTALSYAASSTERSRQGLLQELTQLTHRHPEDQRLAEYLANAQALAHDAGRIGGDGAAV